MINQPLLDIQTWDFSITLILTDKPVVEMDKTNRSNVKMSNEPLWEHQQNVCIESLHGLSIPWLKPLNSIQPENWHKNLSQISDIPIS